jgi:hypothetical protein
MTSIELTEGQRQALEQGQGGPVEVVDPATKQRYVLLRAELYDRVRPLLERTQPQGPSPPATPPSTLPVELRPARVRLRDLPTPPEVYVNSP